MSTSRFDLPEPGSLQEEKVDNWFRPDTEPYWQLSAPLSNQASPTADWLPNLGFTGLTTGGDDEVVGSDQVSSQIWDFYGASDIEIKHEGAPEENRSTELSERLVQTADGLVGQDIWRLTKNGLFAWQRDRQVCAASVSAALQESGLSTIDESAILKLEPQLVARNGATRVNLNELANGDVVVFMLNGIQNHVGIIGEANGKLVVYHSDPRSGRWTKQDLLQSMQSYGWTGDTYGLRLRLEENRQV